MLSLRPFLIFPLAFVIAGSPALAGQQQHLVTPDQLATTVAESVAKQDAKRAVVHEALGRPEVEAVASKLGLDLARAAAAVDAMNGADLEKAADAAQQVNEQLVGGASNLVISTTTLIIILLLVIILIIAIK
jgi:hypothetical protein